MNNKRYLLIGPVTLIATLLMGRYVHDDWVWKAAAALFVITMFVIGMVIWRDTMAQHRRYLRGEIDE